MNKRGFAATLALLLLAALLLAGLPFMTGRITAQRMAQTVAVTATPVPVEGSEP